MNLVINVVKNLVFHFLGNLVFPRFPGSRTLVKPGIYLVADGAKVEICKNLGNEPSKKPGK